VSGYLGCNILSAVTDWWSWRNFCPGFGFYTDQSVQTPHSDTVSWTWSVAQNILGLYVPT